MSYHPSKAISVYSVLNIIIKLLFNHVSSRLAKLFNLSFFRGVFLLILKSINIMSVYKNGSKLK